VLPHFRFSEKLRDTIGDTSQGHQANKAAPSNSNSQHLLPPGISCSLILVNDTDLKDSIYRPLHTANMATTIDVSFTPLGLQLVNFKAWRINIKALLRRHGLWDYVDEDVDERTHDGSHMKLRAAADLMTPFICDDLKQSPYLDPVAFDDGRLLLAKLQRLFEREWPTQALPWEWED
jgi:hypothetical protein